MGKIRIVDGGEYKEFKHIRPKRRWFDDKRRRRKVTVNILKYWGIGQHYYPRIDQEHNRFWDPEQKAWRLCWYGDPGEGKTVRPTNKGANWNKFDTLAEARRWVEKTIRREFRDHKVVIEDDGSYDGSQRWNYKGAGD